VDSKDEHGGFFIESKENIHEGVEGKVTVGDLKVKGKVIEDTRYQGHVFWDLTNCSIINLVVKFLEYSSTILSILNCFKSLKDQK
jgi:hypothetical protein